MAQISTAFETPDAQPLRFGEIHRIDFGSMGKSSGYLVKSHCKKPRVGQLRGGRAVLHERSTPSGSFDGRKEPQATSRRTTEDLVASGRLAKAFGDDPIASTSASVAT